MLLYTLFYTHSPEDVGVVGAALRVWWGWWWRVGRTRDGSARHRDESDAVYIPLHWLRQVVSLVHFTKKLQYDGFLLCVIPIKYHAGCKM